MSNPNATHKLSLQFDGDQVSKVLLHAFTCNGKPSMTTEGRYSGCVGLKKGDVVEVQVNMTVTAKEQSRIKGVDIISLDLVGVPNISQDIQAFSPFSTLQATKCLVGGWSRPVVENDPSDNSIKYVSTWQGDPLTVVAEKGYWQVSGFLGAMVFEEQPGDAPVPVARVFGFDPEIITGPGDEP